MEIATQNDFINFPLADWGIDIELKTAKTITGIYGEVERTFTSKTIKAIFKIGLTKSQILKEGTYQNIDGYVMTTEKISRNDELVVDETTYKILEVVERKVNGNTIYFYGEFSTENLNG